ncbi:hypothetical protein CF394_11920, partial [Tetzosporium hominis]
IIMAMKGKCSQIEGISYGKDGSMKETSPIPQPKTYGPLGNLPLIDKDKPTLSLIKLAEEQGPIFQIHTPAGTTIVVSG